MEWRGEKRMPETISVEEELAASPVIAMLPEAKRARFERYWREYLALPSRASAEELRLQADIAAGVMLPIQSSLHPSTALAVASGLLQYHPYVGEGLAGAFNALTKLPPKEPLRPPLGAYVTYALEELSFRLQTLARELRPKSDNS
jgi:hypothetical protein